MSDTPLIYLASASPRRRELLAQLGVKHQVLAVNVAEHMRSGEAPELYVSRLALEKARAGIALRSELSGGGDPRVPVLGADTVVVVDDQVLGKPSDRDDAISMLGRLSGRTHHVYTGVALVADDYAATRLSVSAVTFRAIDEDECARYWVTGEPGDKAGAYAVQGRGAQFITRLEGSYSGVMGLPLYETAQLLNEFGIELL